MAQPCAREPVSAHPAGLTPVPPPRLPQNPRSGRPRAPLRHLRETPDIRPHPPQPATSHRLPIHQAPLSRRKPERRRHRHRQPAYNSRVIRLRHPRCRRRGIHNQPATRNSQGISSPAPRSRPVTRNNPDTSRRPVTPNSPDIRNRPGTPNSPGIPSNPDIPSRQGTRSSRDTPSNPGIRNSPATGPHRRRLPRERLRGPGKRADASSFS